MLLRRFAGHRARPVAFALLAGLSLAIFAQASGGGPGDEAPGAPGATLRLDIASNGLEQGTTATQFVGTVGATTWDPAAIFNDGVESSTLSVAISGGNFDTVWITANGVLDGDPNPSPPFALWRITDGAIQLFDDGTNGDVTSGDGTYTRAGITASGAVTHDGGSHQLLLPLLYYWRGSGDRALLEQNLAEVGLGVVDVSQRGQVSTLDLGPGLSATSHALFWVDDGTVYPNYPNVDAVGASLDCDGCGIVIEQFGDIFDFIVLHNLDPLSEVPECFCSAFFQEIQNDVEGIGKPALDFNLGATFFSDGTPLNTHSDGKLRGVIWMNQIDGWPLSHEVMHHWSSFAAAQLNWLDGVGHFQAASTVNGLMDLIMVDANGFLLTRPDAPTLGVDLVANGDGTFRLVSRLGNSGNRVSEFGLYLGGFLPASEVEPISILGDSINFADPDRVTATEVTQISVEDVIAIEGARVPSVATSQKDFWIGSLVISDEPYSDAEYTVVTLALRYWESDKAYDGAGSPPWKAATLGVSTITVELPLVFPSDPATITLEPAATTVLLDSEIAISATVSDAAAVPVPAVQVQFSEQFATPR